MVTIKIPAPSSMLVVNLLGALGLLGLAVAVGGLTHNVWWALVVAATEAVFLSVVAATNIEPREQAETADQSNLTVRPRAV